MSTQPVISVEGLSKYYRLGLIGGGTLREDLNRAWARLRGKPDPLLKIGEDHGNRKDGQIWALRDVNLEVNEGEVLGIIGRNGAGKSTLLKILSRITAPTSGRAVIRGRVGSLLEVGTGFHPELTGRENVYLNGAILGMTKAEVRGKLEEIVEFAEMAQFIDTPVKRYSSGMLVRLAFAVAAHLEPEILIVDEVLAVGDARFQKKCLGKMKDVSAHGRTVLFVSHNMTSVKTLCTRAIRLKGGSVVEEGGVNSVVDAYLETDLQPLLEQAWPRRGDAPVGEGVRLRHIRMDYEARAEGKPISTNTELRVDYEFENEGETREFHISTHLKAPDGSVVFNTWSERRMTPAGRAGGTLIIPSGFLNDGHYTLDFMVVSEGRGLVHLDSAVAFEVLDYREGAKYFGKIAGVIRPEFLRFPLEHR